MSRLNFPPRCRSSGTGWKLARVRCVAGSNTSLRHLFCKSVVIAHPKRQFLISSIKGEAKKKHNCIDRSFSCFPAHVNEPDRFEPSAPKTRVAQALRLNFGCSAKIVKTNQETIPGFAIVDTSIRASARITPSANAGRRVPTRSRKIPLSAPSTRCGIIRHSRPTEIFRLHSKNECRCSTASLLFWVVAWQLVLARTSRTNYVDRNRTYQLRDSELHALNEVGKFRVVAVQDLAQFAYNALPPVTEER